MMYKIQKWILSICFFITLLTFPTSALKQTAKVAFYLEKEEELLTSSYSAYGINYLKDVFEVIDRGLEFSFCVKDECHTKLTNNEIDIVMNVDLNFANDPAVSLINHEIGNQRSILYVNSLSSYYNYDSIMGDPDIKIGVIKNSLEAADCLAYVSLLKIKPTINEYETLKELLKAADSNEIDAFVYRELPKDLKYDAISYFKTNKTYFATLAGNVLNVELQNGLKKVYDKNPLLDQEIYNKNFISLKDFSGNFNRDELDYVSNKKTVKIVVNPEYFPIEVISDEKLQGITSSILEHITNSSGLAFEIIKTKSYAESVELFNNGLADIISGSHTQLEDTLKFSELLTNSYLSIPVFTYYNKDSATNIKKNVGLLDARKASETFIREYYNYVDIIACKSATDCLEKVEKGEIELVSLNSYVAQGVLNAKNYTNIAAMIYLDYYDEMCFAVSPQSDANLYSIMNKAIEMISDDEISLVVYKNTITNTKKQTFIDYFKENPLIITLLVILMASIVVGSMYVILRQQRKYNKSISMIAYNDVLTGFGNFNYFKKEAKKLIARFSANNKYAITTMIIGKIQNINILLGVDGGNMVIVEVAKIIKETLGSEETFGRVSKNEFVILKKYNKQDDLVDWMKTMQGNLDKYLHDQDIKTRVYLNAGIFELVEIKGQLSEAIEKSNYALRSIGNNTEAAFAFYNKLLNDQIVFENKIESMMEHSLMNDEFQVYMQPKYSLLTDKIIGAEALIRWNNEAEGFLVPSQFIPLFEKNGFIKKLDYYVYENVLVFLAYFKKKYGYMIPISFNLSRIHLHNSTLVEDLLILAKNYDVDPKYLEIELTETAFFENEDSIIEKMHALKRNGFRLSMDDFGTGYSSLNLLKNIPLDVVKIDKSFLSKDKISKKDQVVLEAIVSMSLNLGLEVICEGVETKEQASFLRMINCNQIQGYLYSKPLPMNVFMKLLKDNL